MQGGGTRSTASTPYTPYTPVPPLPPVARAGSESGRRFRLRSEFRVVQIRLPLTVLTSLTHGLLVLMQNPNATQRRGNAVLHTYSKPGTKTVTLTVD